MINKELEGNLVGVRSLRFVLVLIVTGVVALG